jgi:hypothetical protein
MARARNIKPGFFSNENLAELSAFDRLLFVGLWCLADREGRLEDRPKRIKMELFPCDSYDVCEGLESLSAAGFLKRYEVKGQKIVEIVNFAKHQSPHGSERDSVLPDEYGYLTVNERSRGVILSGKSRKIHVDEQEVNVKPPLDNGESNGTERPDSPILRFSDSPNPEDKSSCPQQADDGHRFRFADIQEAYNRICSPTLPKCMSATEERKRKAKRMVDLEFNGKRPFREHGLAMWESYFRDCLTNKHWIGENDRGWRADFDFVTNPKNAIKLLERICG